MADLARPTWIALANGAPVTDLAAVMDAAQLRVETDRARFGLLLAASRRHLAIVTAPPATRDDEALILRERRRRPSLRIVHLTRPDDVGRRLDALRHGFDEALTTVIALEELVTRLQISAPRSPSSWRCWRPTRAASAPDAS